MQFSLSSCDLRTNAVTNAVTNAMNTDVCQTLYLCRFCGSVLPRYLRPWFDPSPRVHPIQPNPLLPTVRRSCMHPTIPQQRIKMRNCACYMFTHRPRRHLSQRQAVMYASAAPSRKPANSVVALAEVIGSGTVDQKWITRGWRACRPAKVSLAN